MIAATGAATLVAGLLAATPAAAHPTTAAGATPATKILTAVLPHLAKLTDLGAVPAAKPMTVGITIPGDTAALKAAYADIQNPKSPDYQAFLTPQQIQSLFGVSPAVSTAVQGTLEKNGLRPVYVAKDGQYVELSGTAAQVERTFSVGLHTYRTAAGKTFFANTVGATVPSAVSAVAGLTNLTDFATHADQDTCAGTQCTGVVGPTALWTSYDMPQDLYDHGKKVTQKGNFGQGQKVAIFGEGDLTQVTTDLRVYEAETTVADGVTKPVLPKIPVRETLVNDDQTDTAGLGEWDLDSQSSTGVSPDLKELDFYFGEDLSDAAIDGIYSAWVNDPAGPAIGNSSFGGCEPLEALFGDEATDDVYFQEAVMEGRTMFASTGDTGSGGCVVGVDLNGVANGGAPAVEYPSASPYVVAVGGTVLYTAATGGVQDQPAARSLEYAWTETGGGYSYYESQPTDQAALGGTLPTPQPCIGSPTSTVPSGAICRTVPDVAAMSGDIVSNGYGIVSDGAQAETGGTSLSSPLWAGMWARVRAAHPMLCHIYGSKSGQLGFAQPLLYDVAEQSTDGGASAFFDVGGTANSIPGAGNGAYPALPRSAADPTGYDLVSGLGVPDLAHLTSILACGSQAWPIARKIYNSGTITIVSPQMGSCPPNGTRSDPAGDETPVDTALDILGTKETATSTAVTFTQSIADLPETNPAFDDLYDWEFGYAGGTYEVEADGGTALTAPSYSLFVLTTDPNSGVITSSTVATLSGTFDPTTNVVSVVLPFATFNSGAKPSTPLAPGATLTGLFLDTAITGVGQASNADTLSFAACNYSVQGGTST